MSTVAIVVIAVVAILILVAIFMANSRKQTQKREDQRVIASEHRQEAEMTRLSAEKESAAAEEQAAAARRQAAEAEERARLANQTRAEADAHEEHAREIDPDQNGRGDDPALHERDAHGVEADADHRTTEEEEPRRT